MAVSLRQSRPLCATSGNWATGCVVFRSDVEKPVKRSVAVLIRKGTQILSTRRSDADDELPGVWGLPAGSYRGDETLQELVERIGAQKLGIRLNPVRLVAEGRQERPAYVLQMELWEASMSGIPVHPAFRWAPLNSLAPGRAQGSLCCELALKN
jgi:8-oxo-dGTP diphosphatase